MPHTATTADIGPTFPHGFFTEATCGEACWKAKEEVCHCSCGGRNHGCLLSADGERPIRQSKINGDRWELLAVGNGYRDLAEVAEQYCKTLPVHRATTYSDGKRLIEYPSYNWHALIAPVKFKTASDAQLKWPEVELFTKNGSHYKPCLLWKRVDWKPENPTKYETRDYPCPEYRLGDAV